MKYDANYRPELCLSKDHTRTNICYAHLDTAAKRLFATQGNMIVSIPVEVAREDITGGIGRENLVAAYKGKGKGKNTEIQIDASTTVKHNGFPEYFHKVIPEYRIGTPGTISLSFDPKLLKALADAMGTHAIVLTVPIEDSLTQPIVVQNGCDLTSPGVPKEQQAVGVLMPMSL